MFKLQLISHSTQEGWAIVMIGGKTYKYHADGAALFRFVDMMRFENTNKGRSLAYLKRVASSCERLDK